MFASGQIQVQVDEVTASGSYANPEDNLLDANDEIVFMAKDLGDRPSDTTALTGLPIDSSWYEIEVIDPQSPGKRGWAYLVRSNSLTHITTDYVSYAPATKHITTTPNNYELGVATGYIGLNDLILHGSGTHILDRSKMRAVFDLGVLGQATLTDEDLPNPELVLIKDGRVRVILHQSATADPLDYIAEGSLITTDLAYPSLLQATSSISFALHSGIDLIRVRSSLDLNGNASGATFYNANTPGGVTVDGTQDAVAPTPLSDWTQISHTTGRLIQVTDPSPTGGTQRNYYCDGNPATFECDGTPRTGDDNSYGDAGISIEGDPNSSFTIQSWLFMLGAGQDNLGATYRNYALNPLRVAAYLQGERNTIFLPIISKTSQ